MSRLHLFNNAMIDNQQLTSKSCQTQEKAEIPEIIWRRDIE